MRERRGREEGGREGEWVSQVIWRERRGREEGGREGGREGEKREQVSQVYGERGGREEGGGRRERRIAGRREVRTDSDSIDTC